MATSRLRPVLLLLALGCASCGLSTVVPTAVPSDRPVPSVSPSVAPTPDLVAPVVVSQDPPPGGVLDGTGIVRVTFSEPVDGVDGGSFRLLDGRGAELAASVTIDAAGQMATLIPVEGVTLAAVYRATLTDGVVDRSGNRLARTEWVLQASRDVSFAVGTYTGYQFAGSTADLTGLKRDRVAAGSSAIAAEFRVMDGAGYLLIASGGWDGYWVHGAPSGIAVNDQEAPIPPLPTCSYLDLPTARDSYTDWATTVLDTLFQLPSGYAPGDLVDTAQAGLNGSHLVRSVVLADLSALVAAAKADGAQLAVQSAYRSYRGQVLTFNGWVSRVGYDEALTTSARPGHSEHQLGTAVDFRTVGGISPWRYADWATTTEGAWLAANGWRFGWVMSYPRGASAVSCYRYEPWHYRYVGRETAAAVHAAGVTLREWLWDRGYGVR